MGVPVQLITAVVVITVFSTSISAADNIQLDDRKKVWVKDYSVEIENINIPHGDGYDFIEVPASDVLRFNASTMILNISLTLLYDMPPETVLKLVAYQQMLPSREYTKVPTNFPIYKMCNIIEKDQMYWPSLVATGNFPTTCPWKKGTYYAYNYIFDSDKLPPRLPGQRWRLEGSFVNNNVEMYKFVAIAFLHR